MKNFVFMVTLTLSLLLLLTMVAPALSFADDTTKVNCYKAISIHFEKDIEQINSFQSFSIKDSDVCFKNGDSPITNPDFEAKGVESNGSVKAIKLLPIIVPVLILLGIIAVRKKYAKKRRNPPNHDDSAC